MQNKNNVTSAAPWTGPLKYDDEGQTDLFQIFPNRFSSAQRGSSRNLSAEHSARAYRTIKTSQPFKQYHTKVPAWSALCGHSRGCCINYWWWFHSLMIPNKGWLLMLHHEATPICQPPAWPFVLFSPSCTRDLRNVMIKLFIQTTLKITLWISGEAHLLYLFYVKLRSKLKIKKNP